MDHNIQSYTVTSCDSDPDPMDVTPKRNSTNNEYVVRVAYRVRRAITCDGESGYMTEETEIIDLQLEAGLDHAAISVAMYYLASEIPETLDMEDRVEVAAVKIVSRPSRGDSHGITFDGTNPPRGMPLSTHPDYNSNGRPKNQ